MQQGTARLNMSFLLPETVAITPVDENNNPDPCDGTVPGCTPYGFNSGTWRVEVRDPNGSRTTPFLTVLQPTAQADPALSTTRIASDDGSMVGAAITLPGGAAYVMLFNNREGQTPAPITSVTYTFAEATGARHTLAGMKPEGRYAISITGGVVSVTENVGGAAVASPAGVLQFGTAVGGVETSEERGGIELTGNHPNPFSAATAIDFVLPPTIASRHVTLALHDALGRVVRTIVDAELPAGRHSFVLDAEGLPDGVYGLSLTTGGTVRTRQCVLVR
jgi:hypothetical protein